MQYFVLWRKEWRDEWRTLFTAPFRPWIIAGIALHILAAIYSTGFLQFDEHFQILEFTAHKLGLAPASELPYEFTIGMRPWLQPMIYTSMAKVWSALGIDNRFFWTFSFRALSSLLGLYSTWCLCLLSLRWCRPGRSQLWSIALLNTAWFLPMIHARLSGEATAASLLAIAVSLVLLHGAHDFKDSKDSKAPAALPWPVALGAGVMMGLSFELRYHVGIAIFTFHLWALIFQKINWRSLCLSSFGVVLAIGLGTLIDYWGYGRWTLAPWQYVHQNVVLGIAARWGVSPWWDYARLVVSKSIVPFGLVILFSTLLFWATHPRHLLTWLTLPFVIGHSMIGHKEMRFLFPLAPYVPLLLALLSERWHRFVEKRSSAIILKLLFGANLLLALVVSLRSLHHSHAFYRHTYQIAPELKKLIVIGDLNPFRLADVPMNYFNFHHPQVVMLPDVSQLKSQPLEADYWLFASRGNVYAELANKPECQLHYLGYPQWTMEIKLGRWPDRSEVWSLYRCHP